MELLTWTTDDIKHIAEEEGFILNEEEMNEAEDYAYEYLNENDSLNEMIWNLILDAIRKAKEEYK